MEIEVGDGNCLAWAARDSSGTLSPYRFDRRAVGEDDISLKITHCGICFADVIWTRNGHGDSKYPLVPGHEIVGVVTAIGLNVKSFKIGDHVGVGTYVNSCRSCENCDDYLENYCLKGGTYTFNALDSDGTITKGGYSSHIVVHERYCFKIPDGYPLDKAAPLLCAGITVYSPMKRHNMNQPGKSLGVVGLGGLGHMAVKFGKAFGLKVTVISTSESKKDEALKLLGADNFLISSDKQEMQSFAKTLDFIIDTASGDHAFDLYMSLLKIGGMMALVGFPSDIHLHPATLNVGARSISGSVTGGTKEIQEMLNFCAENKIYPEIEVIEIGYANEAIERLISKDVKYSSFAGVTEIMASEIGEGSCLGWAARDVSGTLSPYKFNRRAVGDDDVSLKITHCGVCYADVIWTKNKFGDCIYPVVPGHEIAGVVTEIGSNVQGFSVGDHVGIGTIVDSCRVCESCNLHQENFCFTGATRTYNSLTSDGNTTKGGYSSYIVVHQRYCYKIPEGYPLEKAAPLLCAGITVYSPMKRHNMNQPGKSLGVIGLGGLGHMAVKFGKAFGLKVTVFSTSESKRKEALELLGADNFVISSDKQQMESLAMSLDFIIDTASGDHPFDPYMSLLKVNGLLVLVGAPSEIRLNPMSLLYGAKGIYGSATGGSKDIQEMLNFCAAYKIYPEVEIIKIQYINDAIERLIKSDVKYRFVIDMANSLS